MSTLSLVVVFIAFTFNAIYALVRRVAEVFRSVFVLTGIVIKGGY